MHPRRIAVVAGVAAARATVTLVLALAFWAAAPAVLGWSPTTVMTASMSPAVEVGDIVVAAPVARADMAPGRVLLAHDPDWPGRLRLHRVAEVTEEGSLVTKGDANPSPDTSRVDPGAVLGAGVLRVPWVGFPIVWARTGEMVPLAATASAFLLCLTVALRRGEDEEEDDEPSAPSGAESSPSTIPQTRQARRAAGIVASVALSAGLAATPAWAAFSDQTQASAAVTATRVDPPFALACKAWDDVVTWQYDGVTPRSFELLIDGEVAVSGIPGNRRSASLPNKPKFWPFQRSTLQIRAVVSDRWTADSPSSVTIGGGTLGFGSPVCR